MVDDFQGLVMGVWVPLGGSNRVSVLGKQPVQENRK